MNPMEDDQVRTFTDTAVVEQALSAGRKDFSGAVLDGLDLSTQNFQGVDLAGASLKGARFSKRDSKGAHFEGANLEGVSLEGANLEGALLHSVVLNGARLRRAKLQGANLFGAELEEADLEEADLRKARFVNSNLTGANLTKVDLSEAWVTNANLKGACLESANLGEARLEDSDLTKANLAGANLSGASFRNAILESSNLSGVEVDNFTEFHKAIVKNCKVDHYMLEMLNEYGGLNRGQRARMTIRNDLASLRQAFSGHWQWIHLAALCSFVLPYVLFLGRIYLKAIYSPPSQGAESTTILSAFGGYLLSGGGESKPSLSFVLFLVLLAYNTARLVLLAKTKQLELREVATGLPVAFSIARRDRWWWLQRMVKYGFAVNAVVALWHAVLFLQLPVAI